MDGHTKNEFALIILFYLIFLYIYIKTDMYYLLTTYLAFVSIRNVNIKKIVKIDISLKLIFLISHSLFYLYDYIFNYDKIIQLLFISEKGISHTLYFANPNTVGVILVWLIIDILYLKEKLSFKSIIISFSVMMIGYLIVHSRTALYIFFIYLLLNLIKNDNLIHYLNKYCYYFLALISFGIITFIKTSSNMFIFFNDLFSNRLAFSISAYKSTGLKIMPHYLNINFFDDYVIDNFYVRCFIGFGIITLLIVGLPNLFLKKGSYRKEKIIGIVSSIYLFFENVTTNIGYAIPFLIIASALFNESQGDEKKYEIVNS